MIKIIISTLILFTFTCFGQTSEAEDISLNAEQDSINVMAIFQSQINDANERELKGEIKSSVNESYNNEELSDVIKVGEIKQINSASGKSPLPFYKESSVIKLFLFIVLSMFIISWVLIRRRRAKKSSKHFRKELKQKIKSVRDENLLPNSIPQLQMVRSKLMNTPEQELFEKPMTAKAKELRIGKGELILAAKLKSYQMAQLSSIRE